MTRPPVHPGEVLATELAASGVHPSELARQLNVPASRISTILADKRSITGDRALRLSHWFGTSGRFWLNLQSAYDLQQAELEAGAEIATLPTRETAPPPPAQPILL